MNALRSPLWSPFVDEKFTDGLRTLIGSDIAPHAQQIDEEDVYPTDIMKKLAQSGYSSVFLDKKWGGSGLSYRHAMCVFEEVSYASAAVGISLITIFQAQNILSIFGSEQLKNEFLPQFPKGLLSSYAMTEANHGSDIRSLDTKATRCREGWILKGEKSFITSGSAAEFFIVLAESEIGVSTFAVPRNTPGISSYIGVNSATFGLRNGPHVNLRLDDVQLPDHYLIGTEGKGVRQAVTTLDFSRTMAAGISIGIARAAFDHALRHARTRRIFNSTVFEKQGIQWYFADMLTQIDAARLMAYHAADSLDSGIGIARLSSQAKLMAAKLATDVASTCVQICGAYGVMANAPYGRFLRDAKAYEIAGGSSEILKNTIAKSLIDAEI